MAVKNTMSKNYTVDYEKIYSALRSSDFSKLLNVSFIEEAIIADEREFRYQRKTDIIRYYGRNFFIKVKELGEGEVCVFVTTQSRKVTVLFDTSWKLEAEKVFNILDVLLAH